MEEQVRQHSVPAIPNYPDVKITEYFEQVRQEHHNRATALQERIQGIADRIAAKNGDSKSLKKERKKMQEILADPPAHAFDLAKAKEVVAGLDIQISQCEADINSLTEERSALEASVDEPALSRVELFSSLLAKVAGCEEALQVPTLDHCWPLQLVTISELDEAGRPQTCRIDFGGGESRTLKIEGNEKRFARDYRPAGLTWLPSVQDRSANGHGNGSSHAVQFCAFVDANRRLIVSRTKFSWMTESSPSYAGYGQRNELQRERHEDDFSDLACSLGARFDEIARAENDAVHLKKDYSSNALMLHIQTVLLGKTTGEPEFEPVDEELKSAEIEKRIKEPWLAFVGCPWSRSIKGNLALLKYSAENGERVRFWSEKFRNLYGFRVRTRDHNWLIGEIFIGKPVEGPIGRVNVQRSYGETVATVECLSVHVSASND